jgi:hypothetical protein
VATGQLSTSANGAALNQTGATPRETTPPCPKGLKAQSIGGLAGLAFSSDHFPPALAQSNPIRLNQTFQSGPKGGFLVRAVASASSSADESGLSAIEFSVATRISAFAISALLLPPPVVPGRTRSHHRPSSFPIFAFPLSAFRFGPCLPLKAGLITHHSSLVTRHFFLFCQNEPISPMRTPFKHWAFAQFRPWPASQNEPIESLRCE